MTLTVTAVTVRAAWLKFRTLSGVRCVVPFVHSVEAFAYAFGVSDSDHKFGVLLAFLTALPCQQTTRDYLITMYII